VKLRLWGTRGSIASPGPDTLRYGGNTSCVEVRAADGSVLVLDAGTGIRRLGDELAGEPGRVDLLLTHLHMDHIQGLGFFAPLYQEGREVHIWGPASTTLSLRERLARYLSPPLFPVRLRELPSQLSLHNVPFGDFEVGGVRVRSELVSHPGPTVGYRIDDGAATCTYLPDHEPALGWRRFPGAPAWTSGFRLAEGVDVLVHDTQYTPEEYADHVGWGHSTIEQALAFARMAHAHTLVTFHHDPAHPDALLDGAVARAQACDGVRVIGGTEELVVELAGRRNGAG
jgi:phosphoribosyl 1,2-cyclic phosphodiesterase